MTVLTKTYDAPPYNLKEIYRYAGCKEETEDVKALVEECIKECISAFSYKVCYCVLPVDISGDGQIDLSFVKVQSKDLLKNLDGCFEVVLFGATVGISIDRLIAKYGHISPVKAVIFQAIGAERIESLCDMFNKEIKAEYNKKGLFIRPRFSAGYGDFSLSVQKEIFETLDCSRKIGLSLNSSMLMSPTKSVTALIGIAKSNKECGENCNICKKANCSFRR